MIKQCYKLMISTDSEFTKCSRVVDCCAAKFLIVVQQSFCSDSAISIYFFLLILKYGYNICLFNLLIQVHHVCGPKNTCQKFMVHISKLMMYGHVSFGPHKAKHFDANSAKLQGNFSQAKSNFCI